MPMGDGGYPPNSPGAAAFRMLERAKALEAAAMQKFHDGIAAEFQAATDKSFREQKSPAGEPWPPLAPSTIAQRTHSTSFRRGHRGGGLLKGQSSGSAVLALLKTRRMQRETRYVAQPGTITVSSVDYINPHVTGGVHLPKRNPLVFDRVGGKPVLVPQYAKLYRDRFIAHVAGEAA